MPFQLTDEQLMIQAMVREFARKVVHRRRDEFGVKDERNLLLAVVVYGYISSWVHFGDLSWTLLF